MKATFSFSSFIFSETRDPRPLHRASRSHVRVAGTLKCNAPQEQDAHSSAPKPGRRGVEPLPASVGPRFSRQFFLLYYAISFILLIRNKLYNRAICKSRRSARIRAEEASGLRTRRTNVTNARNAPSAGLHLDLELNTSTERSHTNTPSPSPRLTRLPAQVRLPRAHAYGRRRVGV